MLVRTQIQLEADEHRRAKLRSAELGVSLSEYIRRLLRRERDANSEKSDLSGITALFGLGSSDEPSDIANSKDRYIGEAVEAEYLEDIGEK